MTAIKPDSLARKRATAKETDRAAREIIDADKALTRNKTKRLRAERLAKEASEEIADLDRKKPKTNR